MLMGNQGHLDMLYTWPQGIHKRRFKMSQASHCYNSRVVFRHLVAECTVTRNDASDGNEKRFRDANLNMCEKPMPPKNREGRIALYRQNMLLLP
jgi:hypothetical protein